MEGRVPKNLLKLATVLSVCMICLGTSWAVRAHASAALHDPHGSWVGEQMDNFWGLTFVTCTDGFLVNAQQQFHDNADPSQNPGHYLTTDTRAFYLVLTSVQDAAKNDLAVTPWTKAGDSSDVPGTTTQQAQGLKAHARIAGAQVPGASPVSNTILFRFTSPLTPSAPVAVTFERWDHGLTADDDRFNVVDNNNNPETDGSSGDDVDGPVNGPISDTVGGCSALPSTTATTAPAANGSGWNRDTVNVKLAATDPAYVSLCAFAATNFSNPAPTCPAAADPSTDVNSVTYSATGGQTIGSTPVAGSSTSFNIANEGITTVTYFATDPSGDAETAHMLTVKVDKTPPVITIHQPMATTYTHSSTLTLDYSLADSLSGVNAASVVAKIDGSTAPGGYALFNGQTIPLLTVLPLGPHTFTVSGADNAGNSTNKPVRFTIVATPQSILADVPLLQSSGNISATISAALLRLLNPAATYAEKGQCATANNLYKAVIQFIQGETHPTGPITPLAESLLLADIQYQIGHC